jgi:hypothetical protein
MDLWTSIYARYVLNPPSLYDTYLLNPLFVHLNVDFYARMNSPGAVYVFFGMAGVYVYMCVCVCVCVCTYLVLYWLLVCVHTNTH